MYGDASASLRRWSRCLWAANASALRSSASSPFMVHEAFDDEERGAEGDCRVGDVECRPMPGTGVKVEEIDDLAITQAIDQVAERTAEDEGEPAAQQPPPGRAHEQRADDADRHQRKADKERRLPAGGVREKAESGALVVDQHHIE